MRGANLVSCKTGVGKELNKAAETDVEAHCTHGANSVRDGVLNSQGSISAVAVDALGS